MARTHWIASRLRLFVFNDQSAVVDRPSKLWMEPDRFKISGSQAVGRNGYSSDTRPSSTAALIKAWGSVTPSEAIATIRWAILAFIAGVGREWSIRLTAMSALYARRARRQLKSNPREKTFRVFRVSLALQPKG
jgi:hypothetical protein